MGQLGIYSYYDKTRYAFIMTSVALTVLRFHLIPGPDVVRLGAEYQVIPLSSTSQLTVFKSLCSLTMISMNDKHRQVVPKSEIVDLRTWNSVSYEGHYIYFWHPLTERIKKKLAMVDVTIKISSKMAEIINNH
jgi:hypothetical protein